MLECLLELGVCEDKEAAQLKDVQVVGISRITYGKGSASRTRGVLLSFREEEQ